MKMRSTRCLLFLLLLAALIPAPLRAELEGDLDLAALSRAVDALFQPWHRPDSPGASVLVMRGDEVVHAKGYGMANLEHGVPNRPSTVFDIASVSKQFAGFAIAMLAEQGALSMHDDVRAHIPELPDFGHTIRIEHLVHHTSGLRDWPITLAMAGWDYMDVLSFQQILNMAFHQRELNFPPGSEYAYSNTGYNLLAEIVARVSGLSFREWTEQNIFRPLDMRQTHFHDDYTRVVPDRAESYAPADGESYRRAVSNLTAIGSSSLFTTIEDLANWLRNFDEPVVGGPAVLEQMHRRGVLNGNDTIAYAYGLIFEEYRGATVVHHGGSWAGYRSTLLRFPEHALSIVILGNTSSLDPDRLALRIADLYLADVLAPARGPEPPIRSAPEEASRRQFRPTAAELAELEGEYHSLELLTFYRVRVEHDQLVAEHFRTGKRVLQPVAPDLFQAPGFGRIEFVRDANGRIAAFTANSVRVRGLRFERLR
jgi:CubicO group peptidase (beta-lactamase class C family)